MNDIKTAFNKGITFHAKKLKNSIDKMNKKKAYINIKYEVAIHGKVTKQAMRSYCESRMSRKEFDKAVSVGMNLNKWVK